MSISISVWQIKLKLMMKVHDWLCHNRTICLLNVKLGLSRLLSQYFNLLYIPLHYIQGYNYCIACNFWALKFSWTLWFLKHLQIFIVENWILILCSYVTAHVGRRVVYPQNFCNQITFLGKLSKPWKL